tara:strand:+ start:1788 stop:2591 length:804 start_codon:yes stop_codon:yes gene_type:complete
MFNWFRPKNSADRNFSKRFKDDDAVKAFVADCAHCGHHLGSNVSSIISEYCDGEQGRPTLSDMLSRPLMSFAGDVFEAGRRSLFEAHCYAIVLSVAQDVLYRSKTPYGEVRFIVSDISRAVAEEEVGPGKVGNAPSPRPAPGVHVSWRPGTLVGGVASQQLTLVQRYARMKSVEEKLAMFCLALGLVPPGEGIGMKILEEVPGSRHGNIASYDLVGYRTPDTEEIDEWSDDLEILDPEEVLAALPPDIRDAMLAEISSLDPFTKPSS